MPASVFDFAAIGARLDELGGRQSVRPTPGLARILVVDDSEVNVELLVAVLAAEHYVVSAAYDGSEALAKIEAEKPDIILLDIMMPGLDGYEVCRRVKADPATADIRIMMVTALSGVDDLKRGLEAGADDYLTTPVNGLALMARIRGQLRRKWLQDRLQENFERSLSLALTDELTGLYNRRYLLAHLDELLDRVNHDHISAAILLFDIDHFKQVNDIYGHAAGDEVLRELASRAMNSVRSVDLVARLGGEEFVVVMPETDIVIATAVAERLRLAVAREPFIVGTGGMKVAVTISIGVATTIGEGDCREGLLKRADAALYKAKRAGGNCVIADHS
jgi:two-component system, cell cycle response regulator